MIFLVCEEKYSILLNLYDTVIHESISYLTIKFMCTYVLCNKIQFLQECLPPFRPINMRYLLSDFWSNLHIYRFYTAYSNYCNCVLQYTFSCCYSFSLQWTFTVYGKYAYIKTITCTWGNAMCGYHWLPMWLLQQTHHNAKMISNSEASIPVLRTTLQPI